MRKFIIFLPVLLFSVSSMAQAFLGMQVNNLGGGLLGGYQVKLDREDLNISANSILFTVGNNLTFHPGEKPNISYFTGGYVHSFSDNDAVTISASAGPSLHQYRYLRMIDDPETESKKGSIILATKITGYYSVELGKDFYMGRLFFNAGFSEHIYFGIGLKAFLN